MAETISKHVVAAVLLRNEAETLLGVEPLHGALSHVLCTPVIGTRGPSLRRPRTRCGDTSLRLAKVGGLEEETPLDHKLRGRRPAGTCTCCDRKLYQQNRRRLDHRGKLARVNTRAFHPPRAGGCLQRRPRDRAGRGRSPAPRTPIRSCLRLPEQEMPVSVLVFYKSTPKGPRPSGPRPSRPRSTPPNWSAATFLRTPPKRRRWWPWRRVPPPEPG